MDWNELARALALFMVIESIVPFLAPARWRGAMLRLSAMDDRALRVVGLLGMLSGLAALKFLD